MDGTLEMSGVALGMRCMHLWGLGVQCGCRLNLVNRHCVYVLALQACAGSDVGGRIDGRGQRGGRPMGARAVVENHQGGRPRAPATSHRCRETRGGARSADSSTSQGAPTIDRIRGGGRQVQWL